MGALDLIRGVPLAEASGPPEDPPTDEELALAITLGFMLAQRWWGKAAPLDTWGTLGTEDLGRRLMVAASVEGEAWMRQPAVALVAGQISPERWHEEERRNVLILLGVLFWLALASGGLAWWLLWGSLAAPQVRPMGNSTPAPPPSPGVLPPALADALRAALGRQLGHLLRFRVQVVSGLIPLDLRVVRRAELYARAAWGSAQNVIRDGLVGAGLRLRVEERRVLGAAEGHCLQCPEYASRGWQPLHTLPGIGLSSDCQMFCRCSFRYRRAWRR